jgi:hypothetical protein
MSPKRSRKSLDDALARQFIYGEKQQETLRELRQEQAPEELPPEHPGASDSNSESLAPRSAADSPLDALKNPPNDSTLIDKFQAPPKEATIRFTVDLPSSMHRKLSILAARTGKKKAEIVRVLLAEALADVDK